MSKKGYSRRGFFGQTNHYDNNHKKIGESVPNFLGGSNYYGSGNAHANKSAFDEYEMIENEMMDETYDSDDAAEWLIDNGYDPDDFDF